MVEKKNYSKVFVAVLCIMFTILLCSCSGGKQVPENDGIMGTWYESEAGNMYVVVFYDDGTYMRTLEEYVDDKEQDFIGYEYDQENSMLKTELNEEPAKVELTEDMLTYTFEDISETHVLYRDREAAKENDPEYYKSEEFIEANKDNDGFCIKDGILYAYVGDDDEVTVPNTVKVIKKEAFAFCSASVIVIEEGVETIETMAFMDSYPKEIHFPKSITNIGTGILETEEGLNGTKIYVCEGSAMEQYLKDNAPYGEFEIISN